MKISIIALKVTRHSDSQSILTAFSRELGRVALSLPAGNGRGANRLRALTMPLGMLSCETELRPGREILPIRQPQPLVIHASIHSNPLKQMVAMFVAEVLSLTLRHTAPDPLMFDFVATATEILDLSDERGVANFHICFLLRLASLLGIEPDTESYRPGSLFDMADGLWRVTMPLHTDVLDAPEAAQAALLQRMTFANMRHFRFSRQQRGQVIDHIMRYYTIHGYPLQPLRTLSVLKSML